MKLFKREKTNQFAPKSIVTQKPASTSKRQWWLIGAFVVLGMVTAGSWQLLQVYIFSIDHVEVVESVQVTPRVVPTDQMNLLAKSLYGRSLLLLDEKELQQEWSTRFPAVRHFTITKHYPHTLKIAYIPRVALSQLQAPNGIYLVDREGYIFSKSTSSTLPKLSTSENLAGVGNYASAKGVRLGLFLVEGLRKAQPRIQNVLLHDGMLEVTLASDPKIYISEDRLAVPTLREIKALLKRFEEEKKYPKEMDFRYERPVLRY